MPTVRLPYKLQVWLPRDFQEQLKELALDQHMSLQDLVFTTLERAVDEYLQRTQPPVPTAPRTVPRKERTY